MTTQHDDEVTHYRARVDAIPVPEATPERAARSDDWEDIPAVPRRGGRLIRKDVHDAEVAGLRTVIAERDAEIARLRGWLKYLWRGREPEELDDDVDIACDWYEDAARHALAGEAAPELAMRAERSAEG